MIPKAKSFLWQCAKQKRDRPKKLHGKKIRTPQSLPGTTTFGEIIQKLIEKSDGIKVDLD